MIIYKDIITGSEFASDAYPIKIVDDVFYEVDCQLITVKDGVDIDIGANPSTEEAEEQFEEGSRKVNNVVHAFNLVETTFDAVDYIKHLKPYMKRLEKLLKKKNPDMNVKEWKDKLNIVVKNRIFVELSDEENKNKNKMKKASEIKFQFFVGSTQFVEVEEEKPDGTKQWVEVEGMVALLDYREDGMTPYFILFKDGLIEEKV
uniref:Translationally-controlled tumor n=1 Tax=Anthurium amnicola TaxID=1678845 RepID=A0A1D1XTL1_9ARAE